MKTPLKTRNHHKLSSLPNLCFRKSLGSERRCRGATTAAELPLARRKSSEIKTMKKIFLISFFGALFIFGIGHVEASGPELKRVGCSNFFEVQNGEKKGTMVKMKDPEQKTLWTPTNIEYAVHPTKKSSTGLPEYMKMLDDSGQMEQIEITKKGAYISTQKDPENRYTYISQEGALYGDFYEGTRIKQGFFTITSKNSNLSGNFNKDRSLRDGMIKFSDGTSSFLLNSKIVKNKNDALQAREIAQKATNLSKPLTKLAARIESESKAALAEYEKAKDSSSCDKTPEPTKETTPASPSATGIKCTKNEECAQKTGMEPQNVSCYKGQCVDEICTADGNNPEDCLAEAAIEGTPMAGTAEADESDTEDSENKCPPGEVWDEANITCASQCSTASSGMKGYCTDSYSCTDVIGDEIDPCEVLGANAPPVFSGMGILPGPDSAQQALCYVTKKLIPSVTSSLLVFVLGLSVLMVIVGGIFYLISMGDTERLQKGRDIIVWAILGSIIAILAYTIVRFIINIDFLGPAPEPPAQEKPAKPSRDCKSAPNSLRACS